MCGREKKGVKRVEERIMTTRKSNGTAAESTEGLGNPALATFEAWLDINRPVVAAMSEFNGRLIEQMSKANNEWLGFINRRLNEDIAASQRIMECKTLQD